MPQIVLNADQARLFQTAGEPIELRDEEGRLLTRILPPALEAIVAEVKRRRGSDRPSSPASEVEKRLQRLAEIDAQEPLDEARALDLLRRMRAGEQV